MGAILPGGGHGKGAKETVKAVDDVMDVGKVVDKANDTQKANKAPNPYGSKGKPDHQEKVKELQEKAKVENPGKDIIRIKQEARCTGSRPENW